VVVIKVQHFKKLSYIGSDKLSLEQRCEKYSIVKKKRIKTI
jgi:hypothetical protein